jgi:hypothetical protein
MLSHLKKNKSIESILNKFKNRKNNHQSDSDTDSETESEKKKRLLCEEVGNRASINNLNYVCKLFKKYKTELEDFTYISSESLYKLKLGGTLRYVNINGDIRYGGLLVGIKGDESFETMKFLIRKVSGKFMEVSFEKNYIFFRPRRTKQFYLNKKLLEISENL